MQGYIYCFSNESMPGILKIGMTDKLPEEILKEANVSIWRPPEPYKLEMSKKVSNPFEKVKTLHMLLEKYNHRLTPCNEALNFFRITVEDIKLFFNLIDSGSVSNEKSPERVSKVKSTVPKQKIRNSVSKTDDVYEPNVALYLQIDTYEDFILVNDIDNILIDDSIRIIRGRDIQVISDIQTLYDNINSDKNNIALVNVSNPSDIGSMKRYGHLQYIHKQTGQMASQESLMKLDESEWKNFISNYIQKNLRYDIDNVYKDILDKCSLRFGS